MSGKFVEINFNPDAKTLRQFGYLCLVLLPIVGWSFSGWQNPLSMSETGQWTVGILAGVGAVLAVVGTVRPMLLKWVFIGLCLVALPIGLVVSELLMLLIFFGIFTPVALLFRLIGRDALERKLQPAAKTYWRPKPRVTDVKRYFRQS